MLKNNIGCYSFMLKILIWFVCVDLFVVVRSWTYQTCTEFGYYQTGSSSAQPFSPLISLQSFLQTCADMFGIPNMTPNIEWTNEYYGSTGIQTTNTVFTSGSVDPVSFHLFSVIVMIFILDFFELFSSYLICLVLLFCFSVAYSSFKSSWTSIRSRNINYSNERNCTLCW